MPTLTTSKRTFLVIGSAAISYFAYPSPNLWPVIFLTVAGMYFSIRHLSFWRGFVLGFLGGFSFYVAQIYWMSQYLGPEPLVALSALEALIFGLSFGLVSVTSRLVSSLALRALVVAMIWTGREWFATHFPYGGFPWSRVSMSQSDSPLAHWVAVGGFGLLSFLIVFISVYLVEILCSKSRTDLIKFAASTLVVFLLPFLLALAPAPSTGTLRIAGIQGNANAGLFAHEAPGTIRDNHLQATEKLLASKQKFDLVVWPENASDIDPTPGSQTEEILRQLVDEKLKKPFIFGSITTQGDRMFNSSKLWLPGRGVVDQYDKKRPVPFGEFVPDREFFYSLAPDLVGLISRGYDFGTRDGIFKVGHTKVGILICFEEAIDELPRDLIDQGASVVVAQTNNADFGHSDESVQQLAIARLRAIEIGRSIVSISTVGPSAIIDSQGHLVRETKAYVADYVLANVQKHTNNTLTILGGWLFDPAMAALTAIYAIWLFIRQRRTSTKL